MILMTSRAKKHDLVYYMHDGAAVFGFRLSGDLAGDGVRDLEQAWRTASSIIGERGLVVDVSSVTRVDDAGRELLERWQLAGARILGAAPKRRAWSPLRLASRWLTAMLTRCGPAAGRAL